MSARKSRRPGSQLASIMVTRAGLRKTDLEEVSPATGVRVEAVLEAVDPSVGAGHIRAKDEAVIMGDSHIPEVQ